MKTPSKTALLITFAALLAAGSVFTSGNGSSQSGCCCPALLSLSAFAAEAAKATPTNAPAKPSLPRLVDLGADKCIPCKMMAPILKELKTEYAGRMEVEFVDVWKQPDAGKAIQDQSYSPPRYSSMPPERNYSGTKASFPRKTSSGKWKELGVSFIKPAK